MRFVNKKIKAIVITLLVIVSITGIFFMSHILKNKNIKLDEVVLKGNKNESSMFAIMLDEGDGTYEESKNNKWPSNGYNFNSELSGCIDSNGNALEGILSYDKVNNMVKMRTNKATYCYLYFKKNISLYDLCKDSNHISECIENNSSKIKYILDLWDSTLEDDGYRYVGTDPNNYICFGTNNMEECKSDTDKYMYRIIGIFKDSSGNHHLKLIKKEALNTAYAWNAANSTDIAWNASSLCNGVNGDYFLNNTSYLYMQDSNWNSLIETWNYIATNTKTYDNYSSNSVYGPYYYYTSTRAMYIHEMNKSGKANETCYYGSIIADCTVGEWTSVPAKIGLMYASEVGVSVCSQPLQL